MQIIYEQLIAGEGMLTIITMTTMMATMMMFVSNDKIIIGDSDNDAAEWTGLANQPISPNEIRFLKLHSFPFHCFH